MKFAGVGAIGTITHYTVLIVLVDLFDTNAVLASSVGAITGASVNYVLNYRYTFRSSKQHRETLWKFLAIAAAGFVFNGLLMMLLTGIFSLHYLLAQIVTTGLVLIWNFLGSRLWAFHAG